MSAKDKDGRQIVQERQKVYNERTKEVMEAIVESQTRVNVREKKQIEKQEQQCIVDIDEQQYEILVGQLKSAEARNRLHIMRMRHEGAREREVAHLVSCQPTAMRAVRLEAIMGPPRPPSATAAAASASSSSPSPPPPSAGASRRRRLSGSGGRMSKADRSRLDQLMSS